MSQVENLMLDHLKPFQASMSRAEDKLDHVAADLRGMKRHMAAFMGSEFNQDAEFAAMKLRLERIERRLDLID